MAYVFLENFTKFPPATRRVTGSHGCGVWAKPTPVEVQRPKEPKFALNTTVRHAVGQWDPSRWNWTPGVTVSSVATGVICCRFTHVVFHFRFFHLRRKKLRNLEERN